MSSHKVMYHVLEPDEIEEELDADLIVKSGTRQSLDKEYLVKIRRTRRGGRRKILILGFSILVVSLLGLHVMYSWLSSHPDHHVKTLLKQEDSRTDFRTDSSPAVGDFGQDSDQVSSDAGEDSTENGVNAEDWNSLRDRDFSHDQQMIEKNFNHSSISAPFDINSTTDVIVLIQIPYTTNQLENLFTSELSIENQRSSECGCRRRSGEDSSRCKCTKSVGSGASSQKLNWLYSLSTMDGSKCQPGDSSLDWTRVVASDSSSPCSIDNFFDALDSSGIKRRPFLATYLKDPVKMVSDILSEEPVNKHSLIDLASEQVKDRGSRSCSSGNSDPRIRLSKCSLDKASIQVDQPNNTSGLEARMTVKDLVDCHHELLQSLNSSKTGNLTKQEVEYLITHSRNNPFNVMTKFLSDLNIVRSGSEINLDSDSSDCETTRLTLDQVYSILLRSAEDNLSKMSYFGLAERLSDSRELLEATFPGFKLKLKLSLDSTPSRIEQLNTDALSPRDTNSTSTNIELKETEDSDTTARIRDLNQLDILLYQYARELFEDRLSKSHGMYETHSRD